MRLSPTAEKLMRPSPLAVPRPASRTLVAGAVGSAEAGSVVAATEVVAATGSGSS